MRYVLNIRLYWPKTPKRFKSTMSGKKVLITNPDVPQAAIDLLSSRFETIVNQEYTRESILAKVAGVSGILWATKVQANKEILDAAGSQLEIIGAISAGYDHIDVDELKKRGVKLSNTSMALSTAVADMAVFLTFAAARRTYEGRQHIEKGTWILGLQWMLGHDIGGSTVGIVGLGPIGQAIAKRIKAFDVKRILCSGHKEKPEGKQLGAEMVSFDELLKQSDFVIVSCPLTPETKEMFNESAFNKMKKTAVFVNVARGGIVDQPALIKALKNQTIFAAGLDVMVPEPLPKDHELLRLPNCVLTPHLASATIQTRTAMAELAAKNIIAALDGKTLLTPVF